jgi:hypothetical protein
VVVAEQTTQPLKNKTIDADLNTLSNISDTNMKAGASISRSKLAPGSNNYVVVNNGTGVMSEEQYLDRTRGGTGISSTATFPSSGTVATTSNKISDFASSTSLELAGKISDEVGTGKLVFNDSPNFTGNVLVENNLRIQENGGGTDYVQLQAPTLSTSYTVTLPNTLPSAGSGRNVLSTDDDTGTTLWTRALSTNTASSIVRRDGSGNFEAGTITATLSGNATNVTGIVAGANGGTGVDNTGKTITLGGNLTTSGAFATTLTATNTTSVTLPTSGTLATLDGTEALSNKTITASSISSTATTTVGTGALKLPTGNGTTDRPTGTSSQLKGMIRYNSDTDVFEGQVAGSWVPFAASSITANSIAPVGSIVAYNPGYYTSASNGGFTLVGPATNDAAGVNAFLPANWRVCDGDLAYNVDSPIWNVSSGNTRRVPNLTGSRFLMGSTAAGSIGGNSTTSIAHTHSVTSNVTVADHTLTIANLPSHTHTINHDHASTTSGSSQAGTLTVYERQSNAANQAYGATGFTALASLNGTSSTAHTHSVDLASFSGTSGATGTGTAVAHTVTNNAVTSGAASVASVSILPTYLATFYIIRIA